MSEDPIYTKIKLNKICLEYWYEEDVTWMYDVLENQVHFFRKENILIETVPISALQ